MVPRITSGRNKLKRTYEKRMTLLSMFTSEVVGRTGKDGLPGPRVSARQAHHEQDQGRQGRPDRDREPSHHHHLRRLHIVASGSEYAIEIRICATQLGPEIRPISAYPDPEVDDGTQWEIKIQVGKRCIVATGSNAYPPKSSSAVSPKFRAFCAAVSTLVAGRTFK